MGAITILYPISEQKHLIFVKMSDFSESNSQLETFDLHKSNLKSSGTRTSQLKLSETRHIIDKYDHDYITALNSIPAQPVKEKKSEGHCWNRIGDPLPMLELISSKFQWLRKLHGRIHRLLSYLAHNSRRLSAAATPTSIDRSIDLQPKSAVSNLHYQTKAQESGNASLCPENRKS